MTKAQEKEPVKSKFDRSKFKDNVSSGELKAADKQVEDITRTGKGNYAGFHKIEDGLNTFLLYPSHENIKQMMGEDVKAEKFVVPKQQYWLPREVDDLDDNGNVKMKGGKKLTKIENKNVFDARVHSEAKKDIVDLYISLVKKQKEAEFGLDTEQYKESLYPIYGKWNDNKALRINGIIGKPAWIIYAEKVVGDTKVFGRLEIGKAVKMRINDLIALEESGAPIGSDSNNPFTDVELRRALKIIYNSNAKVPNDYYKTDIDSEMDKDANSPTYKQIKTYPLSDEDLENFLKFPSLSSMYKNVYSKRDFDLALSGLRIFDDQHEFGIFGDQEFLDAAENMRDLYPEPKEEAQQEYSEGEAQLSKGDEFANMERDELKQFSRENKTGILIIPKVTDDDLRDQLRTWRKKNPVEGGETEVDDGRSENTADIDAVMDIKESAKNTTKTSNVSAKERITKSREKMGMGTEGKVKGKGK